MYRDSQRYNLMASTQTIIVGIIALVGIAIILYAVVGGSRILLYYGLCITGVGVGLGVLQFILMGRTSIERRKMQDLRGLTSKRPGSDVTNHPERESHHARRQ
jgi:hypothetical protein